MDRARSSALLDTRGALSLMCGVAETKQPREDSSCIMESHAEGQWITRSTGLSAIMLVR